MKFSGSVFIAKPRAKVWDALNNPDVLAKCIPGCEKPERIGEDEYTFVVKGSYTGRIALRDKKPPATAGEPASCTLEIEGKGPSASMRGTAKVTLAEKDGKTELAYDADVQIGGLLASLGSRLIEPVAKDLLAQFFQSLEKQI